MTPSVNALAGRGGLPRRIAEHWLVSIDLRATTPIRLADGDRDLMHRTGLKGALRHLATARIGCTAASELFGPDPASGQHLGRTGLVVPLSISEIDKPAHPRSLTRSVVALSPTTSTVEQGMLGQHALTVDARINVLLRIDIPHTDRDRFRNLAAQLIRSVHRFGLSDGLRGNVGAGRLVVDDLTVRVLDMTVGRDFDTWYATPWADMGNLARPGREDAAGRDLTLTDLDDLAPTVGEADRMRVLCLTATVDMVEQLPASDPEATRVSSVRLGPVTSGLPGVDPVDHGRQEGHGSSRWLTGDALKSWLTRAATRILLDAAAARTTDGGLSADQAQQIRHLVAEVTGGRRADGTLAASHLHLSDCNRWVDMNDPTAEPTTLHLHRTPRHILTGGVISGLLLTYEVTVGARTTITLEILDPTPRDLALTAMTIGHLSTPWADRIPLGAMSAIGHGTARLSSVHLTYDDLTETRELDTSGGDDAGDPIAQWAGWNEVKCGMADLADALDRICPPEPAGEPA
ncbi:hypothetical protein [Dietzia sp. SYD-A1]|uniref:hypothetical protein n=1 Tax=Dietzia sp. SYD-A1 TaxID=2780141 RepID=UPI001891EF1F|nr:hypothetical protein [Dietzia sp. SYD-A1]